MKRITTGRISDRFGCHANGFFENGFADSELQFFSHFLDTPISHSRLAGRQVFGLSLRTILRFTFALRYDGFIQL